MVALPSLDEIFPAQSPLPKKNSTPEHELMALLKAAERIDLTALPETSTLMTRTDRKYVLTYGQALAVLERESGVLAVSVDDRTISAYQSDYYDTEQFTGYLEAAHGRRHRFKVRARTYVDTNTTMLEVKTKSGRGETVKQRIDATQQVRTSLDETQREFIATTLKASGRKQAARIVAHLRPALTTEYSRATLLGRDGSRTTIDLNLVCSHAGRAAAYPHLVLIETKSAANATELDRTLWKAGHRPVSVSKFATGMVALYPQLPHNKWHRVLTLPAMDVLAS